MKDIAGTLFLIGGAYALQKHFLDIDCLLRYKRKLD